TLFGPVQSYSGTSVFMAMSDVDGMCRPLGYQIFVFVNGKFAGTLSPTPMNSRADGAMGTVRLTRPDKLSAEFVRYTDADPLCCPSKTGAVDYRIDRSGKGGLVVPTGVIPLGGSMTGSGGSGSQQHTGSDASFENTYWKLMELNGNPVAVVDNQREAHFRLDPKEKRVQGSGGCNQIGGSYEVNGEQLRFSQMFTTKMACQQGMDTEQEFLKALGATTGFKLSGENLELYGDGKLLARLESRYFK
ncbi:MAG: META domain-containing protein, partial [Blastocatellia bacterium]